MPVLQNPRHEQFAQLVAAGMNPAKAYAAAGYEERAAYSSGPRLLKTPEVRARVTELRQTVAQSAVLRITLGREFVLRELMDNASKAKELQEFSASNRALELLGRELGMFHSQFELGNITSLEDVPQHLMDQMIALLEKAAAEQERLKGLAPGGGHNGLPASQQTVEVTLVSSSKAESKS